MAGAHVHRRKVTIAGTVTHGVNRHPRTVTVKIGTHTHIGAVSPTTGAWLVKFRVSKGRHKTVASTTDPGGVHHMATRKFRRT